MWTIVLLGLGLLQPAPTDCALRDTSRPAQFIAFERMGEGDAPAGESRQRVWLRLQNNSSCAVRLPRGVARACDGSSLPRLVNGACVRLEYDVFSGVSQSPTPWKVDDPEWSPAGAPRVGVLDAGASLVFSVPQAHFVDDHIIAVAVADIHRDGADGYQGSQRYLLFGRADLSTEIREKLRAPWRMVSLQAGPEIAAERGQQAVRLGRTVVEMR